MSFPSAFRLVCHDVPFSPFYSFLAVKDLKNIHDFSTFVIAKDSFPRLPPELERDIFELTIQIDRRCAFQLVVVAKRVQVWYGRFPFILEGPNAFLTKSW